MDKCNKLLIPAIVVVSLIGLINADEVRKESEIQYVCRALDFDVALAYEYKLELKDKFRKALHEANNGHIPAVSAVQLRSLIERWGTDLEKLKNCKPPMMNCFGFGSNPEKKKRDLHAAISYAFYDLARRYLESDQLIAAATTIIHLRSLRTNEMGIATTPVLDLNDKIKAAVKKACDSEDLDRLLGSSSMSKGQELDRLKIQLTASTYKPSFIKVSRSDDQNYVLRRLIDLIYDAKASRLWPQQPKPKVVDVKTDSKASESHHKQGDPSKTTDTFSDKVYSDPILNMVLNQDDNKQQGVAATIVKPVEEQTHHNDEAVQVQVAGNEHDAEIELGRFRKQIEAMLMSFIKDQRTQTIRQCDGLIPAMERYISGHHDAEQTTWRRKHLSLMQGGLEYVIFYKAFALKMNNRCTEAQVVINDLVRRQSAGSRTPLQETLNLAEQIRRCH